MPVEVAGRKFSNGDAVIGVGLIVAFITVFLPWYSASASSQFGSFSSSVGGLGLWAGWLFFLVTIAGIVLFVIRNFVSSVNMPALPQTDAIIFLIVGIVLVVLGVLWLLTGGGSTVSGPGYSAGPSFGLFIGLIAGAAVAVGGFLKRSDPQPATRSLGSTGYGTPPPPPPSV
ncbi:MAG TPA: hypothetical protein VNY76_02190 [Candidatus Acidoferrales bacterium]|jgi:hypothetical protein|nr:hypothetical protein [Candidatus Acidoferrales bacterium]